MKWENFRFFSCYCVAWLEMSCSLFMLLKLVEAWLKFVTNGLTIWLFLEIHSYETCLLVYFGYSSTITSPNNFSYIFNGIDIFVNFWWYGKFQGRSPTYLELTMSRSDPARSYRHFPCPKIPKKKLVVFFLIAIKNYIN